MKSKGFITGLTSRIPGSFKDKGFLNTLLRILYYLEGYLFDKKYHTDTFIPVVWDASGAGDIKMKQFTNYDSVHVVSVRNLFRRLRITPGKVLVDLGCGKGRILLLASEFGFREVRGVEISPVLCNIARNNCSLYAAQKKTKTRFTVIESDVRDYRIQDDDDVFYIYNTFNANVLKQVLQDITLSFKRKERKIWIIYCLPMYSSGEMTIETGSPVKVLDFTFRKNSFKVYEVDLRSSLTTETGGV